MAGVVSTIRTMLGMDRPQGLIGDVNTLDPTSENMARFTKYRHNWEQYKGVSIARLLNEDGTPLSHINYLKRNVDKVNWFAFGRKFRLTHPEYQPQIDVAMETWGPSVVEKLLRIGQFGSVTGDVFIMVAPAKIADAIVKYNADLADYEVELPAQVKVVVLNSAYCTPVYDAFDSDTLLAMEISIPMRKYDRGAWQTSYQHFVITRTEIITSVRSFNGSVTEEGTTTPNPIGEIYVTHIRNYPCGDSVFGLDDVMEVSSLNTALVEAIANIGQILRYHGDPITVVYGAKATNLKKGPNKIWGNLPKDARIENLSLDTDLGAAKEHVGGLKTDLHAIMGVPEIAQGTHQAISNTSGVALHTMYLPLIERAVVKHMIYGPKFIEVVILSLRWLQNLDLMYIKDEKGRRGKVDGRKNKLDERDFESLRQDGEIYFDLPLPKDRLIEAQIQQTLVAAKLQTHRDALVALGDKRPDDKLKAIKEDAEEFAKLAMPEPLANAQPAAKEDPAAERQINSGAQQGNGIHKTETDQPRGRPRT